PEGRGGQARGQPEPGGLQQDRAGVVEGRAGSRLDGIGIERASAGVGQVHGEAMNVEPSDVYTEPSNVDVVTLRNLGPLTWMAGVFEGTRALDVNPKANGPERQAFVERIELQPIDPQTNGPQLFYGLRYHTHITKPGEVETFHDQVGYWLWEPA